MPVRIASKADYYGSITPPALNTEVVIVEITPQSDDYIVEGYIDLGNMNSGDAVTIKEYIAVDGSNYRPFERSTYYDKQERPIVRFHTKMLYKSMKYKVTLNQIAGTLRSFPYFFVAQVLETV